MCIILPKEEIALICHLNQNCILKKSMQLQLERAFHINNLKIMLICQEPQKDTWNHVEFRLEIIPTVNDVEILLTYHQYHKTHLKSLVNVKKTIKVLLKTM